MTDAVTFSKCHNIALIKVSNPPVNALSHQVRLGLQESAALGIADPDVHAMIILCEGRTFIAGADIREFGKPMLDPRLWDVAQLIENSSKPVIAAIHGTALGGGLELALGCHFRIALATAKLGFPEVKLGLMPGAGGTQRLPRLIGVRAALDVIVNGVPLSAQDALNVGLIDEIVDGDLEDAALRFAERMLAKNRPVYRTSELAARLDHSNLFEEYTESIGMTRRGFIAPLNCIKAVRGAVELPFAEGMKLERALFAELSSSSQAKAQQHVFFAEREVMKVPGLPPDIAARDIKSVAVLGADTASCAIAMCFADAGIPVVLLETSQMNLDRGLSTIQNSYAALVREGVLTPAEMAKCMGCVNPALTFDNLKNADFVVESLSDKMSKKQEIFAQLDSVCKPGAILACNTAHLNIDDIATATERPRDVIGMHFFSPVNSMKALEIARGAQTSPEACATAMKVAKAIGKLPVLLSACSGLVGSRMLSKRMRESFLMLEEGASPQQIDDVLYDFGFPMGPYQMAVLAGLDADKGTTTFDPVIEGLIVKRSKRTGIESHAISAQEILERCLYSLINEGAKILEEGIAARPLDIDIVWIHGYGFPAYRGGPMFHADLIGLTTVYDAILKYQNQLGSEHWKPSPLLEKLTMEGKGFYSR